MKHPDIDFMMVMERRRDELAQAAHSSLLKEADAARTVQSRVVRLDRPRFSLSRLALALARGLSFLGSQMLSWSCRLQYRYEVMTRADDPSPCG